MAQQEQTRKRLGSTGTGAAGSGAGREIPDKLYFRIGEVAKLCEVPAYVLRFWESEFPQLKPNKGGTGQRLYRRRDVEMALRVKTLLYDEGYTIAGARQAFKVEARKPAALPVVVPPVDAAHGLTAVSLPQAGPQAGHEAEAAPADRAALLALRKDLHDLHALLARPAVARPAVQAIRPPRVSPVVPGRPLQVPLPVPTPFARPRLLTTSAKLAQRQADPASPGLFDTLSPVD